VPLWLADLAKGAALTVLIGGPLLFAVLWLMDAMGSRWWLYVWLVWLGTNLLVLFLYPTVIAPLFNKFTPLADAALKQRIDALLTRCGFRPRGPVRHGRLEALGPRQRLFHRLRPPPSASSSSTPCWKSSRRRKSRPCWRTNSATSATST
jgi:hypothetical protein